MRARCNASVHELFLDLPPVLANPREQR